MTSGCFRFADFTFVPGERTLSRGAERIDVSSRYLDALTLLLRDRGRLVTKDRFMDEVWRGVPVTDEALTQCIRTLRRELGDDAARPRFIETVPKHGYRFIAEAKWAAAETSTATSTWPNLLRTAGFAGVGGAVAGVGGGLLYGLAMTSGAPGNGVGAISMVLVLVALNMVIGLTAGLGVGAGIAASSLIRNQGWQWSTAGGMVGGLLTGGIAKLLGLDGFALLFGHSPAGMTGAAEGALLGAAMGYSVWVAIQARLSVGKSAAVGGLAGAAAGLLVPLLGGHLLGGSLNLLARGFPDARLRLDSIGSFLGEPGFGQFSESVTATIEGGLFGFCLAGALALATRPTAKAPFRKSDSGG
jgi:DNA-binding winged helix-turn-helix (wHTH) protein